MPLENEKPKPHYRYEPPSRSDIGIAVMFFVTLIVLLYLANVYT